MKSSSCILSSVLLLLLLLIICKLLSGSTLLVRPQRDVLKETSGLGGADERKLMQAAILFQIAEK